MQRPGQMGMGAMGRAARSGFLQTHPQRIAGNGYDPWGAGGLTDPYEELKRRDPGAYSDFMNPEGDPRLFSAISERASRGVNARRRATLTGMRARMGSNPSAYGFAALRSDLEGQSDLAGSLADARVESYGQNRRFREGMFDRTMGAMESRDTDRRGLWGRAMEREHEVDIYGRKSKIDKKNRRKGIKVGPVGFSW